MSEPEHHSLLVLGRCWARCRTWHMEVRDARESDAVSAQTEILELLLLMLLRRVRVVVVRERNGGRAAMVEVVSLSY